MAAKREIVQLVLSGDVRGVVKAFDVAGAKSEAFKARVSSSFAAVGRSFATIGPGLAAAAGGIGLLVNRGSEVEKIAGSFESLTRAAGLTGDTLLTTVRTAVKGTVSDMDIMAASNKALLLGLPVTDAQMGTMAESAVALGQAMGQGANKSLDDLITALGRSSPLILDNLGLTVKVSEANEAYAATLGKRADKLTDAEKKQAFFNAAMDAAKTKTAELGGIQDTAAGKALALENSLQNQFDQVVRGTSEWGAWAGVLGTATAKIGEATFALAPLLTALGTLGTSGLLGKIGKLKPALAGVATGSAAMAGGFAVAGAAAVVGARHLFDVDTAAGQLRNKLELLQHQIEHATKYGQTERLAALTAEKDALLAERDALTEVGDSLTEVETGVRATTEEIAAMGPHLRELTKEEKEAAAAAKKLAEEAAAAREELRVLTAIMDARLTGAFNRVTASAMVAGTGIGTISLRTAEVIPVLQSTPIAGVDLFGIGAGAERATRQLQAAGTEGGALFVGGIEQTTGAWARGGGMSGMFSGMTGAVTQFATGGWKSGIMSMVQTATNFLPPGMAQAAQAAIAAGAAIWKAIKRPSEEEIAARKSFAGIHASAVEMFGQTATYTESVQRLVADGWDQTLAETVAGFEHAGAAAGVSHAEIVALYAQYQQAVKDGNTELVASIEETYQGWIDSAAEAEAETTAAAQRSTNAAVSGFERAKSEGERAYKTIYEAAIEAGATEEEAVAKAGAARDAEREKTLAAEGEKFARLAAFNAALALGTEATEAQRSAAADAAAAAALESWDVALTAVTAADTAAADAMSADTGGPARTKDAIDEALTAEATGALPAVVGALDALPGQATTMAGGVNAALDAIQKTVSINISHHTTYSSSGSSGEPGGGEGGEGMQHGTGGLFRQFGAGTPLVGHGMEAIVPRFTVPTLAGDLAAALASIVPVGATAGGPPVVIADVRIGDSELDRITDESMRRQERVLDFRGRA